MIGLGLGIGLSPGLVGGAGAWSPLSFGADLVAWFRGDHATTGTWSDTSGNGNDATAAGSPTISTLGGQAAVDLSGGAHYDRALTSLVTAGSAYTVLAVAQGNATGGALLTLDVATPYATSQILDLGGHSFSGADSVYAYSDGVINNMSFNPTTLGSQILSPFDSEHSYAGAGNAMTFYVNGVVWAITGGVQGTESGTTGFQIGTNAAAQAWSDLIAEIVVVKRAITAGERTSWRTYKASRYGF